MIRDFSPSTQLQTNILHIKLLIIRKWFLINKFGTGKNGMCDGDNEGNCIDIMV